jgi:biopolymer transport protein ExbD
MIDVVFLLLVFFMLAARFGQDFTLPLSTSGSDAAHDGAPRLVTVTQDDLRLNGVTMTLDDLLSTLNENHDATDAPVFVQPLSDASVQRLVDVLDVLQAEGRGSVIVVAQP